MLSIRFAVAGVALVALMFGATSARACDDRFPFTCPVTDTSAGPDAKESAAQAPAKRAARPSKPSAAAKNAASPARKTNARESQFEPSGAGAATEVLTEAAPLPRADPRPKAAVRTAANDAVTPQDQVNEIDLSADRLLVSSAPAPQPAAPAVPALAEPAVAPPPPSPPQAISVKTTTILRTSPDVQPFSSRPPMTAAAPPPAPPVAAAPVTTGSDRAEAAVSASRSDSADASEMSWLRRIFLGLGGVLALASAVRMIIG